MFNWLKHINWKGMLYGFIWICCLTGLFVLMSFINLKSRELACTDMTVIIPGEQAFVERSDIDQLILKHQGALVGRTLENIPIDEIEHALRTNPFVEDALVYMDMNGVVNIHVRQREAVLRVINQMGSDFYLDKHGLKIPTSLKFTPRILIANGYIAERYNDHLDTVHTSLVRDLYKTADFINADSLWREQVEQLYVNTDQDIELVPRVGNQRIILGDADSIATKFDKLMLFYKQIVPKVGWDAYKTVNLKFANQIVCEKAINNNLENRSNNSINSQ